MSEPEADSQNSIDLPMVAPPDPVALAEEKKWLTSLESAPITKRWGAFLRRGGPGYLQSSLTLGGGTAAATLMAGGAFGYQLLWVAPLSMLLGLAVLSAVAHQTLSTGKRPLAAIREHAGPFFAFAFIAGAVLSSVIWHFAQYALASAAIEDIGLVSEIGISRGTGGLLVLGWAIIWSTTYGRSPALLKLFERSMQVMVWMIVLCFAVVVAKTGISDVGAFLSGFIPGGVGEIYTPDGDESKSVDALSIVVAGLAAAIGANMVFLYPYSLLARGWGREHRSLARFDLFAGMFVPYLLTTTLIVVAAASTFGPGGISFPGKGFAPIDAAEILGGTSASRILFDLGLLGMVTSSITMHMICCGFAACETLGWQVGSKRFRLACLLPTPGILGAFYWGDMAIWIAVPTTILTGFLLPAVYIGILKMQRSKEYLGEDRPQGPKAMLWQGLILLATLVLSAFLIWKTATAVPGWLEQLTG
ncbi:MAG: divalent metal cation transporter [Planctomycetota bacterium]|nr:divalent metal cation transporter [Planctomycetota bacterium]